MSEWIGEGVRERERERGEREREREERERERKGWSKRVREGGREGASE